MQQGFHGLYLYHIFRAMVLRSNNEQQTAKDTKYTKKRVFREILRQS